MGHVSVVVGSDQDLTLVDQLRPIHNVCNGTACLHHVEYIRPVVWLFCRTILLRM
jgi:hypothetical protein